MGTTFSHSEPDRDIITAAFDQLYLCAYYLELGSTTYHELTSSSYVRLTIPAEGQVADALQTFLEKFVTPDDRAEMKEFLRLDTLPKRLEYGPVFHDYRSDISGWCRASFSIVETTEDGAPSHLLLAIHPVSSNRAEQERRLSVIAALSNNYGSVFHVNFDSDLIIPYRLNRDSEKKHGVFLSTHPHYADVIEHYLQTEVCSEDCEMLRVITSPAYLKRVLPEQSMVRHQYRVNRDDQTFYCQIKIIPLDDFAEQHRVVLGITRVDSVRQRELERYAYTDELTGDFNFNYFKEKVYERQQIGTLIAMDIRGFRTVNLALGIARANEVLRQIWLLVKDFLTDNDLATHLNGDQFAIFLAQRDRAEITRRLVGLTAQIRRLAYELKTPMLTACFGVTAWSKIGEIENSLGDASSCKNKIKQQADKNIAFFDGADAVRIMEEKLLEDKFEKALIKEQFEIWFQPKFSVRHKKQKSPVVVGAEALVRWRDDKGDLISPGRFIPVFERNGMIRTLDEYIFRHACKQMRDWQAQGLQMVPVSINLSRASLFANGIAGQYRSIADSYGIATHLLPIEITESATIENEEIAKIVKEFISYGFKLHMDDFGSGYSSLSTLNVLPFDTLKIDKTLIDYIGEENGNQLLCHIIGLAHALKMHVTAEGVEDEAQANFLWSLSCDNIQGFFFSRPVPPHDFCQLLQQQAAATN